MGIQGGTVNTNLHAMAQSKSPGTSDRRHADRHRLTIPGRIIWRDSRGTPRFSSILTRDVSEHGALVECLSGPAIPMHRLVHLQLDRTVRGEWLPSSLRQGRILSAVYRVGPVSRATGLPDAYALRLLVDPAQQIVPTAAPFAEQSVALLA